MSKDSPKPKKLVDFRLVNGVLHGTDTADGTEYRIAWCGNGHYSHYVLIAVQDREPCWYVYEDQRKDPLFNAIYDAEMELVYKAVRCPICEKDYISRNGDMCGNCHRFKRVREEDRQKRLKAAKLEWFDVLLADFEDEMCNPPDCPQGEKWFDQLATLVKQVRDFV